MKLEVTNGVVKWTVTSTDEQEFVVVGRCSMSPDAFDRVFNKFRESNTNVDAYERAEILHENLVGERRYSCYESYLSSRSNRRRK